jgi:hypothetical protein
MPFEIPRKYIFIWWWKKSEYPERTTDHGQATGNLDHLWLRVECTLLYLVISSLPCNAIWNPQEIYLYLILIRFSKTENSGTLIITTPPFPILVKWCGHPSKCYFFNRFLLSLEEVGVPGENHRPWASNWQSWSLVAASRVHPFCNLQSPALTHAVLVIGLYELFGNPTT